MAIQKKILERIFAICILVILLVTAFYFSPGKTNNIFQTIHLPSPTPTPEPPYGTYHSPTIPKKDYYVIAMVGDSMTEVLGPHGGKLSELLNSLYQSTPGHQRIIIDNYAKGATNILGLLDALKEKTIVGDKVLDPLLSRQVDMILVESYGYNPLSQLGVQEGLKKQSKILDQLMRVLTKSNPNTAILFVATIAPHKATYALEEKTGEVQDRIAAAEERILYIKNHMDFARSHGIPLIDIFTPSLTPDGDGNILYVNPNDHIHPSFAGLDFINDKIAHFIYDSKILPE